MRSVQLVGFSALVAAALTLLLFDLSIIRGEIGDSRMGPHFAKGDGIWVDRLTPRFIDYAQGEVVSVRLSRYFDHGTLMRVIAGPGAPVEQLHSAALADGEYLLERVGATGDDPLQVVQRTDINGRVILRVRPLERLAWRPGLAASSSSDDAH
jgi:hypothetical protein